MTNAKFQLPLLVAGIVFLTSCGGGGGGGGTGTATPIAPITATGSILNGVAAVGAPIVGGNISVICASGSALRTMTSSTGMVGAWQVTLAGHSLPCAVEVSGGNIGTAAGRVNTVSYHAVAMASGTVNVTPFTDLIVANIAGTAIISTWFAGLSANPNLLTAISQTQVTLALAKLNAAFSGLTPLGTFNPITSGFTPTAGSVGDDLLTALASAMTSTGVTYASLLSDASTTNFTVPDSGFNPALKLAYAGTVSGGGSGLATLPFGYVVEGGLTWVPNNLMGALSNPSYTYTQAVALCAGNINGQTGWRLPTQPEVNALYLSGVIDQMYLNNMGVIPWVRSFTWTSTSGGVDVLVGGVHNIVDLNAGTTTLLPDSYAVLVTCVR